MIELPKSLSNNFWSYKSKSIIFNDVEYKTEEIKAEHINIGDIIVVTNGWQVYGIGEVITITSTSKLDKFRNVVPLVCINVKLNSETCSSYEFHEELYHLIRKII